MNPLLALYASGVSLFLMRKERTKHAILTWEATTAFLSFAAGIGSAVLGGVFTAITWVLGGPLHPWLHGLGTALLILAIPLLIFSGYCLDWCERDQAQPNRHTERTAH